MTQPKIQDPDRPLAYECWCFLMSISRRATDPKLKSSAASWAMMIRDALKLDSKREWD